jgi:hypothetical protein
MLGVIVYVALVSNLAEYGENMRFRLTVEPLIWVSSAWGVKIAYEAVRNVWRGPPGMNARAEIGRSLSAG